MNIVGILLAGGVSQRYQENTENPLPKTSKLLEPLTEHDSVLSCSYTVLSKINAPLISEMIIVCHPDWEAKYQESIRCSENLKTTFITGGNTRRESVFKALTYLKKSETPPQAVLIHDAARPLVQQQSIETLINEFIAKNSMGASLAHKIADTIKKTSNNGTLETISRENLWGIETPQLFNFDSLYEAHLNIADTPDITDDLVLLERAGIGPLDLVENKHPNFKITTPQDLALAKALLNKKILY